ncbi:uncharacterized protein LTR77_002601 [Saxophila tyrrhenica]|uniref:J domain-containing protein n=1 Tax=Saxophila tyrrhenica TaxID=1690608 RepID=A0AAV9PM51_9PEZI|nr:hypothetical protein LTR77_002601 [Saxophila tyrrhenica]
MDSLPPDPYLALGVAKDATAAAIKTQYRKLVLKCHPDKVQDESLKQEASDRFHKIQTAYEIIGDEDRRSRYDAQCKLAELRKDVMERGGGGSRGGVEVKTAGYKMPTDSSRGGDFYAKGPDRYTRVSPQYEERRPSYVPEDYFNMPRATSRKHDEYDRSSKRPSPKDDRPKAKTSSREAKESERSSRKEKSRRTDKDVRRDRERKSSYTPVEEEDSEYDSYERRARKMRDEDDLLRKERAAYQDIMRKQKEEAESGVYQSERANKMFSNMSSATDRIRQDRAMRDRDSVADAELRPPPVRYSSSKDKVNVLRGEEVRPSMGSRKDSGRPKSSRHDTGKSSRQKEREAEYVEEVREPRRSGARDGKQPPPFVQTKSAPENIRPGFDRQRSYSVQEDFTEPPIPHIKRAETFNGAAGREPRGRKEGSKLRQEEAYITPERTPEPADIRSSKRNDGYVDDNEVFTEVREPSGNRRYTRSPSPIKERQRPAASRHATAPVPPPMPRTTSHRYVYGASGEQSARPEPVRQGSTRLFGEMDRKSPKPSRAYSYAPPAENIKYRKDYDHADVKYSNMSTGYDRKSDKPGYSRGNSGRQAVYAS